MYIIQLLLLGALAGWAAGIVMNHRSKSNLDTIIIGIIGSWVGSRIFDAVDIAPRRLVGTFVMALVGSIAVLWVIQWVKRRF